MQHYVLNVLTKMSYLCKRSNRLFDAFSVSVDSAQEYDMFHMHVTNHQWRSLIQDTRRALVIAELKRRRPELLSYLP